MASAPITSWQIDGEIMETVIDCIFLCSKITADDDCSHEIKTCLLIGRKAMTKPRQHTKKQRHYFTDKGPSSQSYGFSDSHVQMWDLDHKEGWALKIWCFWTALLEKTLEIPLDCKTKPVNPKASTRIIHWKDWCWSSNTLATWCKELTHWKRPWCWKILKAGREGDNRR